MLEARSKPKQMKMDAYLNVEVKAKLFEYIKSKRIVSLSDVWEFLISLGVKKDVYKPLCELLEEGKIKQVEISENVFFTIMEDEPTFYDNKKVCRRWLR